MPDEKKDDNTVTLTINGRQVTAPKGMLLVEAAKLAGIEIPVFCYHPKLKPVGACRMCLVEIEKMPRLQTACTTPIADGMVVQSTSPNAISAQNGVIELLLANHPLDCPVCDKGGECPLQDNTFKYGLGFSRMGFEKRHKDKAYPLSDLIVLDRERCIMCYRCTRFQAEIAGDYALTAIDRAGESEIGTLEGESFDSPFSGNTIEICPVGALTSRQYRFRARPWDLKRTPSTCAGCAVGCNIELHARDGRILRMVSRENPEVDDGWLCDYGRFETLPPLESNRPLRPEIRRGSDLEAVSWDDAIAHLVEQLRAGRASLVASPTLTNEALWLLNGPIRAALPDASIGFWPRVVPTPPLEGAIANLPACTRVLLAGLDPWTALPVLALWVRKAVVRGASLVAIGPDNGLFRDTAAWLQIPQLQVLDTLEGLLAGLRGEEVEPGLQDAVTRLQADNGPAALLVGTDLYDDPRAADIVAALAEQLGAGGAIGGLVGAPALAANGRGVLELAPDLAKVDPRAASAETALVIGPSSTLDGVNAARLVLATSGSVALTDAVQALLPLAHPYEQAGSLTNLEGRVQRIEPSGFAAPSVLPDWALLARLATALGATVPTDLTALRSALAAANPSFAERLSQGRLTPTGVA